MEFKNKPNHVIKGPDGKNHWISRSLAVVTVVILNKEKVLLVKRGKKQTASGKWCNPCGYLDWDESATQCVHRELWEETGLSLNRLKIDFYAIDSPWDIVTEPTLNRNQDIALYYGVSIIGDTPIVTNKFSNDEIDDVKWVNLNEISQFEIAFKHDKRIEKFINFMNENK